jgi:prophage regulatory protein
MQDKLIRLNELSEQFSIPKSTIWHWVKTGQFPKPIKLGIRFTAWRVSELNAWLDAKQNSNSK